MVLTSPHLFSGLEDVVDPYPDVTEILVYPTAYVTKTQRVGPLGIVTEGSVNAGEAWMHGPVVLSWDAIEQASFGSVYRCCDCGSSVVRIKNSLMLFEAKLCHVVAH